MIHASKKDLMIEHVVCNCVKLQGLGLVPYGDKQPETETHKFPIITIDRNCKNCGGVGFYHRLNITPEFTERIKNE